MHACVFSGYRYRCQRWSCHEVPASLRNIAKGKITLCEDLPNLVLQISLPGKYPYLNVFLSNFLSLWIGCCHYAGNYYVLPRIVHQYRHHHFLGAHLHRAAQCLHFSAPIELAHSIGIGHDTLYLHFVHRIAALVLRYFIHRVDVRCQGAPHYSRVVDAFTFDPLHRG